MRGVLNELYPIVAEDELQDALEKVLCDFYEEPVTVSQWHRRVSDYSSSHLIEEIDVRVAGQSELKLIFKDLSRNALLTGANGNRLPLGDDALREIEAYRKVLRHSQLGTATFYGAHVDETMERYWLFLERLAPVHLWQMGEFAVWERVAAWLARTHMTLANCATLHRQASARLLRHDSNFYHQWIRRAQEFVRHRDKSIDKSATREIDFIAEDYDWVVQRLLTLPLTVIHGEFFASNVLLDQLETEAPRVCPVDWEMAAYGPGLVDLAALTSGNWTREQRDAMANKYYSALPAQLREKWDFAKFQTDFDCCRLHQAVQFLGWARDWSAPPEHAQDWLDEALAVATRLRL
jgi:thiamine kinase-like enzyme